MMNLNSGGSRGQVSGLLSGAARLGGAKTRGSALACSGCAGMTGRSNVREVEKVVDEAVNRVRALSKALAIDTQSCRFCQETRLASGPPLGSLLVPVRRQIKTTSTSPSLRTQSAARSRSSLSTAFLH